MEFIAIDVETANADMASICQIGIARFSEGFLVDEWSSLIDPEDDFDLINIDIHGITEKDVAGSPTIPQAYGVLNRLMSNVVCVSHTHFDRVSIGRALEKYSLKMIEAKWLDSAKVVRRTWADCAHRGYGLANVCEKIGYEFKHHDALEDAKAAGHVLLEAARVSGISVTDWLERAGRPITVTKTSNTPGITMDANPNGGLYGEVIAFTGSLNISRKEAAVIASNMGCVVASGVTKKTTLLVVGDQDITKLAGKEKSSKHIKAEKLISKGSQIRIIRESDFKKLVAHE